MGSYSDDSEAYIWRIPALLSEEEPENGQATKSGHIQVTGSGGEARASGAVFQAALTVWRLVAHQLQPDS